MKQQDGNKNKNHSTNQINRYGNNRRPSHARGRNQNNFALLSETQDPVAQTIKSIKDMVTVNIRKLRQNKTKYKTTVIPKPTTR